jgi:hypothetical protein
MRQAGIGKAFHGAVWSYGRVSVRQVRMGKARRGQFGCGSGEAGWVGMVRSGTVVWDEAWWV